jgi:hypothetical protein
VPPWITLRLRGVTTSIRQTTGTSPIHLPVRETLVYPPALKLLHEALRTGWVRSREHKWVYFRERRGRQSTTRD